MNSFERSIVGDIPLGEACSFFLKLKYGSAGPRPAPTAVLGDFAKLSAAEQAIILEEAGVAQEELPKIKVAFFKLALEQTPNIQEYLAREQEGMQMQEQNEVGFMRQRMMEMQQQMAGTQQGQAATQQQMQTLEQQIAQSQAQIQMAQQSAMDAQQLATQAQQGQLSATDEAMRSTQLAAQMRMAYQQLRSQMMDVASQDPAAGLADQLKGMGVQDPMASMGAPPTAGAPSPEMGPAGQAAGAQPTPDAAPPEGETGANNQNASGKAPPMQGAAPAGAKQASARLMGAAVGAGLGGLGTALEARAGTKDLKKNVQELEGQQGGFVHALNLAQSKARLAMSEAAEQHPVAATLAGSLVGAGVGAGAGPAAKSLLGK